MKLTKKELTEKREALCKVLVEINKRKFRVSAEGNVRRGYENHTNQHEKATLFEAAEF